MPIYFKQEAEWRQIPLQKKIVQNYILYKFFCNPITDPSKATRLHYWTTLSAPTDHTNWVMEKV
jgi:hypothetical protein